MSLSKLYESLYPALSIESSQIVADENEMEIYIKNADIAKIIDVSIRSENQTQYGLFQPKSDGNVCASSHRVRETIINDNGETTTTYELTFKLFMEGGKKPEHTVTIDREGFDLFKNAADSGMIKTRYIVPAGLDAVPAAVFEVDVFPNFNWVKIDLELPEGCDLSTESVLAAITAILPDPEDIIIVKPCDKAVMASNAKWAAALMGEGSGTLKGPFND